MAGKSVVRELYAVLGLDFDEKSFDQVEKKLESLKKDMESLTETMEHFALSMAAGAATIFGFAKFTADAGDQAVKTSQKLGINIEALQELQYAAKESGVDAEELTMSMKDLARTMGEAKRGSGEASMALRKGGVDLSKYGGKLPSVTQAIGAISERFAVMQDGPEKAALAVQLFGRAGLSMIPMLNKGAAGMARAGAEARELGVVMTETQAKMGEHFNDTVERGVQALKGLRNTIGLALIPDLDRLINRFVEFVRVNRMDLAKSIGFVFKGLSRYLEISWKFMMQLVQSARGLVQAAGGIERVATAIGVIAAIFAAGAILSGIASVVTGIYTLVKALTLANLAAEAIPILIGAALIALGLIIEDVVTYFQGGESFFGDFVKSVKETFDETGITEFFDDIKNGFKGVEDWVSSAYAAVKPFIDLISPLFSAVGGAASSVLGAVGVPGFGPSAQTQTNPQMATGLTSAMANGQGAPVQIQSEMTFNVGDNVDPAQVGPKLQSTVADGLQGLLRKSNQSFQGAPVY